MSSTQPSRDPEWPDSTSTFSCALHAEGPDAVRVAARGELDLLTAPMLANALGEAPALPLLILDLSELTFIDSSGLQAIVAGRARFAETGCRFVVVPGGHQVQRLFELTGIDRVLEFVSSPDARGLSAARSS